MAGVALGLFGVYVVVVFGAGYVSRRRYRLSPIRLRTLRGTPLGVAAAMAVGFGLLVAGPVVALGHGVPELAPLANTPARVTGTIVFVVALLTVARAQRAMGASWRVGLDPSERTDLVTRGPFRRVRNPIYSSLVAMALGTALMVGNVVAVLAVLVMTAGVVLQVRLVEEPYLAAVHRSRFDEYRRLTGRFVPVFGRRPLNV